MMSADNTKKVHGYTTEFTSVDALLAACRRVRDAGYTKTDAFTPFPVHGLDEALGIKPTQLPLIALMGGLTGVSIALAMQIWMNGFDYPYIISGKPFISLPAFIPVSFELTILLASFGAFFGMLALNGLPCFSSPFFTNPRFDSATDDRFFLYISAEDPRYDAGGVQKLLSELGGGSVDEVVDDNSSDVLPKPFMAGVAAIALLSVIPLLVVARMRVTTSSSPRFHVFLDMDLSPAKDAQQTTTLFADSRTMRPDVPGTIARTSGDYSVDFYTGVDVEALAKLDPVRAEQLVRFRVQPPVESDGTVPPIEETTESSEEQPAVSDSSADVAPVDGPSETAEASGTGASTEAEPSTPADTGAVVPVEGQEPTDAEAETQSPAEAAAATDAPVALEAGSTNAGTDGQPDAAVPAPIVDNTPWLKTNPLTLDRETLSLGQRQFNIYCAVCHGQDGFGNGLVNVRAQRLQEVNWVPPSSLHQAELYTGVYPDGKLFNTITNGVRKMPGYASQITAHDRWAIVAYVRALQLSRSASESDVPPGNLPSVAAAQ